MSNSISAVVTTADICAIGVMEGARLGGLRIPVDLSIVGYDNLSLCQYTTPKLTSVSQNIVQKAQVATKLLLEKILSEGSDSPSHAVLDVGNRGAAVCDRLVLRAKSGRRISGSPLRCPSPPAARK